MKKAKEITDGPDGVNSEFRCGTVALAGRSNVGKSTLLNRLIGAKIAIETEKPQATRTRVLGIRTLPDAQIVWIDLPGVHRARSTLNRRMVDTARRSIEAADVVLVVIDAEVGFLPEDAEVVDLTSARARSWLVAVNKIDLVGRQRLLALVAGVGERFPDRDVVPVSARTGDNLPELERAVAALLPVGPPLYPEDELTDQPERLIVQECVREKIYELTGEEIPYQAAVVVDRFEEKDRGVTVVHATILVEKESQKRIVIGKGGRVIRDIGTRARRDLEEFFDRRFFLELFVKVRPDWTKYVRVLGDLGI